MPVAIEPEPSDWEREAIIAALAAGQGSGSDLGAWERAALDEGVEEAENAP